MKMKSTPHQVKGLTLIEMMTVVAVVGIISAIAWPIFEGQRMKQRRAQAVAAAVRISGELQSYFSNNNFTYVGYAPSATVTASLTNYSVTTALAASTYTVTLTAINSQAGDADCTTLTINNLGQKGYTGSAPSAVRCWGSN